MGWLSYATGIFLTKDKSKFGTGSLDGLLFVESAKNASRAGGAFPTILFGVPGGRTWAFVIVALLSYGIAPGPQMLERNGDIVTMMVFSFALGVPAVAAVGVFIAGRLAKLTLIPYPVIGAVAIPLVFLGASSSTLGVSGGYVVFAAAALGLLMKRYQWPRPPLVAGLLLSNSIERFYPAFTTHEAGGMFVWPLLLALPVAGVVVALVSKRGRIGVAGAPLEEAHGSAGSNGTAGRSAAAGDVRRVAVTPLSLFTMAIVAGAVWGFYEAVSSPLPGRAFPLLASLAVVVLGSVQLVFDLRRGKSGAIMDIGMRSAGMAGRPQDGAAHVRRHCRLHSAHLGDRSEIRDHRLPDRPRAALPGGAHAMDRRGGWRCAPSSIQPRPEFHRTERRLRRDVYANSAAMPSISHLSLLGREEAD